jgi:hypothetical protein
VVAVSVGIIRRADIVHLVRGSALHATSLGLLARKRDPEDVVRVDRVAGAADVLLVAGGVDDDGVVWRACIPSTISS